MLPIEVFERNIQIIDDVLSMPIMDADRIKAKNALKEAWDTFLHVHDSEQSAHTEVMRLKEKNKKKGFVFSFSFFFGPGKAK